MASSLQVLDLTDNYIGELSAIKHLADFRSLSELSFQSVKDPSKGSNPICDFTNYAQTVQMYLGQVKILDGQKVGTNETPKKV